ncbi:peptidase P60 [Xenorhabdus vietnamensis]|uniref:Peptidase P60 n=1 Tax=Xenorhabdus vietnamensis TaxID=351656 RepID=A0A1Y2S926_9GAMM|nr:NlpC/P60 family protein [Xenorhabdus vietnamensis]OTA15178.1 peptidase P60 [Xenorhabdus vietnamensis]OTA17247.1 peptidase P60 [Xenorhabdus vietnamensis]
MKDDICIQNHLPQMVCEEIEKNLPLMTCGLIINLHTESEVDTLNIHYEFFENKALNQKESSLLPENALNIGSSMGVVSHMIFTHCDDNADDLSMYQEQSNQLGLCSIVVLWPSGRCVNIDPETHFSFEGRPYILGKYDCYSLIRDYYHSKGIILSDYLRNDYYSNPNIFADKSPNEGFIQVNIDDIKIDDMLIFDIPDSILKHAGIYTEDNMLLHHLPPGKSVYMPFTEKWRKRIDSVWRHKQLVK